MLSRPHKAENLIKNRLHLILATCRSITEFNFNRNPYVERKRCYWFVSIFKRNSYLNHIQNRDDYFWLKIRIQRKISRRLICNDNRFILIIGQFWPRFLINAYAITNNYKNSGKMTINLSSLHINRREI